MKKKLLLALAFLYALIIFLPKTQAYYALEHKLKKFEVVLNKETTRDFLGVFSVNDGQVFYQNMYAGAIENISIYPFVFYNQINIKNAKFSKNLRQILPQNIDGLNFKYTPFYPFKVFISGEGDFGSLSGGVNLKNKKVKLILTPSKEFANSPLIGQFRKTKDGYINEFAY